MTSPSRLFDDNPPQLLSDQLSLAARIAGQVVGLLLVLLGAGYVLYAFTAIGGIVRNPNQLDAAVAAMARTIDAEHLAVKVGEETIAPGRLLAMLILLLWYLLWSWIPLAILGAGGRLLYWTFRLGNKPAEPPKADASN